ncbi:MAG: hypothetical protein ACRCZF_27960, partial [Gemmataceae bacterium]
WLGGPPETMWYHSIRPFREGLSEEAYLFRGFGFLGLLFVALREGLRQRGTALGRHLAVGALTAFILTLLATNFWGVSPWMLVQYLPGGGGLRAVGRLSIALDVVLLPTVALAVVETVRRSRRGAVLVAGLVLLMAIEQWTYAVPTFMVDEFYGELPALGARLKGADLGAADVDFDHYVFGQTKAMWAGFLVNVPMISGYSGRWPENYPDTPALDERYLRNWLGTTFRGKIRIIGLQDARQDRTYEWPREARRPEDQFGD